jgi:predicted nucleic acid-binding protein
VVFERYIQAIRQIRFYTDTNAGKAFLAYRKQGGRKPLPLPDFIIGAHAAIEGYQLLTRDTGPYRRYFPTVQLISPD